MIFTTSHKAKGLEWDTVVVHDDFAPFVDDLGDPVSFVHAEEINAWHVAVTRGRLPMRGDQPWIVERS